MLKLLSFWTIFCRCVKNITKSSSTKNYLKICLFKSNFCTFNFFFCFKKIIFNSF